MRCRKGRASGRVEMSGSRYGLRSQRGRIVLLDPGAQRHVAGSRGVVAVGRQTVAQDLAPDRIEARVELLHGHLVLGAQPTVGVAVEQGLAGTRAEIGALTVPD